MCGCAHIHNTACARTRRGYLYATDESVSERRTISQTFTAVDFYSVVRRILTYKIRNRGRVVKAIAC